MKTKLWAAGLMVASLVSGFAAQAQNKPDKIYLGVGNTDEYWQQVIWGAEQVAKSVGAEVVVLDSGFDGQKHMQQLSSVLLAGCEGCAFVWFPDSPAFTKVSVERVAEAGAYMTTLWNRPPEIHPWDTASDAWVANLSFNGVESGYLNGKALCEAIGGEGNIVVVEGAPDNAPKKQRTMGFEQALAECPGMKVLDTQNANWMATPAQEITRAWLARYGEDIDGIFVQSDGMLMGVIAALREAGMAGKIPVTGSDGQSDVLAMIKSGEVLSTIYDNAYMHGATAAALAYAAAVGDIELATLTEEQRDFFLKQFLVTKDNIDEVLANKPKPEDFTYDAIKKDFWAASSGKIPDEWN